jgi:membrane protease YdiL (CAAX protease family)
MVSVALPGRTAVVLVAYSLPSLLGAPWPTHCLLGWAVWKVLPRLLGERPYRSSGGDFSWNAVPFLVMLGLASGTVTLVMSVEQIRGMIIPLPVSLPESPVIPFLMVPVFAMLNSLGEELIWRDYLVAEGREGSVWRHWFMQSSTFGLAHWGGIPSGWPGVLAAAAYSAIIYGVWRRWGFWAGCWSIW